jgi:hypothetical protein
MTIVTKRCFSVRLTVFLVLLISIPVILTSCALSQTVQYSTSAPGNAPNPAAPTSPDMLRLQAPEPSTGQSTSTQTGQPQAESQQLLMVDESAAQGKAEESVTGQTYTRMVVPSGTYSPNSLYISYASQTIAGCYLYNSLPIWVQNSRSGPLWFYEWYPDGRLEANYLGTTYPGWYRWWFYADSPGWHILQYYCNGWSNYIYVYVYGYPGYSPYQTTPQYTDESHVILRSSWFKGYDVYLDGSYVGTEGSGGDPLDGTYRFNAPGDMWHTIVISRGGQSYDETGTFLSGVTYRFTL